MINTGVEDVIEYINTFFPIRSPKTNIQDRSIAQ